MDDQQHGGNRPFRLDQRPFVRQQGNTRAATVKAGTAGNLSGHGASRRCTLEPKQTSKPPHEAFHQTARRSRNSCGRGPSGAAAERWRESAGGNGWSLAAGRDCGMRLIATAAFCAGAVLFVVLIWAGGAGLVWRSAGLLGPGGFMAVTTLHLALMGLMGAAWWLLEGTGPRRWPRFAWGRAARDSAAEVLPLSQLGGYVVGARAVTLVGVGRVFAAASTVVDVTAELVAQLGYAALGLALLDGLRPGSGLVGPALAAVAAMAGLAAAFIAVQARGVGLIERCGAALARTLLGRGLGEIGGGAGQVQARIHALHARPAILLAACAVHAAAWLLNGVETWLTLRLMGVALGVPEAIVIDSLLYGLRSVAFMVPSAIGVQEGGLILLCGLFGVGADTALALSLIKRARDLLIGIPVLLAWQGLEGHRAWGAARALRDVPP